MSDRTGGDRFVATYDQFLRREIDVPDTRTATVWLAIDDSTIENGCMRFVLCTLTEPTLRLHEPQFGDRGASHAPGTNLLDAVGGGTR